MHKALIFHDVYECGECGVVMSPPSMPGDQIAGGEVTILPGLKMALTFGNFLATFWRSFSQLSQVLRLSPMKPHFLLIQLL